MGLIRELTFAALFGAGKHLDAFLAAFQIPNLMRDLFAEGALSTAFTTTFTKTAEKEGPAPAWRLANLTVSAVLVGMGAICLLGIVASPLIVQVTNFGFHSVPGKFELTVHLTRILFPFILFVSLASLAMGILNARLVFGLPASASTVFNIVSVVLGVGLAFLFEPQDDWRHPRFTDRALYGVTLGVLLGGLAQLAVQLPALFRQGYRFRWLPAFRDPRLVEVWRLMWPTVLAGAAVQVNVLVNGMFASEIDGARSWLNCAFRLMQFPIGVFGVAIATATLPAVSRHHARNDLAAFGHTVEESLRLALYLTVPASVGLAALAPDLIGVIYQHGRFTAGDTAQTAAALRAYTLGLAGYAGIKVLTPCFSALGRPQVPLRVGLLGIGVNAVLNFVLVKALSMGHVGLATTTGLLALVNFTQLAVALRRHVGLGRLADWARLFATVGLGSAACGGAALGAARFVGGWAPDALLVRIAAVLAGAGLGAAAYFGVTLALRTPESRDALRMAMRKLRR
jgi:putative peptidoglycan lipid II flippase